MLLGPIISFRDFGNAFEIFSNKILGNCLDLMKNIHYPHAQFELIFDEFEICHRLKWIENPFISNTSNQTQLYRNFA